MQRAHGGTEWVSGMVHHVTQKGLHRQLSVLFSESIRVDDTLKGDASNIERILGTRTGFRDDGKRQWLVKLCGRKEG